MNLKVSRFRHIYVYIFSVIWAFVSLYPLFFTIISSLKNNDEIFFNALSLPSEMNFDNYYHAFVTANIGRCIINTLVITSLSVLLLLVVSSMASYAIATINIKVNEILLMYFTIGIMVPIHVTLIPLYSLISKLNGENNYLTMILLYAAFQIPMSVFLITGFMKGISNEIKEAAVIDGCGVFRLLLVIYAPLSAPIISTSAITAFLFIYKDLIFAVLFITKKSMYTISLGMLAFVGEMTVDMGPIFASIVLSTLPMTIVYLLFQEKIETGLCAGAIKG